MKTYYFWVTPEGKGPMKVAEDGRTASEARQIVEARFPGAKVIFAEGFQVVDGMLIRVKIQNKKEGVEYDKRSNKQRQSTQGHR